MSRIFWPFERATAFFKRPQNVNPTLSNTAALAGELIFINYRRSLDYGSVGRLYDGLLNIFGTDNIFMDVTNILAGKHFPSQLSDRIASCDIFLVIITAGWADVQDENGSRRLHNTEDWVRIEIESALRQGKRILPILIDGAKMPTKDLLPESLSPLVDQHAALLRNDQFKTDIQVIVNSLAIVTP